MDQNDTVLNLDFDTPIYIYGSGGNCRNIIRNSCQYSIYGIIDKRADELKQVLGVSVIKKEEFVKRARRECAILISIKNVFDHSQIVRELQKEGFRFFIFKPLAVLRQKNTTEAQKQIDLIYEAITDKYKIPEGISIPVCDLERTGFFDDTCIIKSNAGSVTAWVPDYMIFNYDNNEPYGRMSMLRFPLVGLYKYFLDPLQVDEALVLDSFSDYIGSWTQKNSVDLTEELRKSMISSRYGAFKEMEQTFESRQGFFIENAPEAKYLNGRFYLVNSGRNRVAYMIAKKYKLIPIKMGLDSYERWKNEKCKDEMVYFLQNEYDSIMVAPLPNPYFWGEQSDQPMYYENICLKIAETLADIKNECKTIVYCNTYDQGCITRYLKTLGYDVLNIIDERWSVVDRKFLRLADKLGNHEITAVEKTDLQKAIENVNADCHRVLITDNCESLGVLIKNKEFRHVIYIGETGQINKELSCYEENKIGSFITSDGCRKCIMDYSPQRKRMVVFGCGGVGKKVYKKCNKEYNIVAFTDNNPKNIGRIIFGRAVVAPSDICLLDPDVIAIGVYKAVMTIKKQLTGMGFTEDQIIVPVVPPRIFYNDEISYDDVSDIIDDEKSESTKKFLAKRVNNDDNQFESNLEDLKKVLSENNISINDVCICSGGVLQAYGLRKSKLFDDIDIIMMSAYRELYGKNLVIVSETAEMHPQNEYDISDDEIIRNSENHFIYKGVKFVNPDIYKRKLSKNPSEELELINRVI